MKRIIDYFKKINPFRKKPLDSKYWNSHESKVCRLEQLISMGENNKLVAHKLATDSSYSLTHNIDNRGLQKNYRGWITDTSKELKELFSTDRNASKFYAYSAPRKYRSFSLSLADNMYPEEIEEEIKGKVELLEGMLKELKKDVPKRSKIYLFFRHPLVVSILVSGFWLIVKLIVYLPRGYKLTEIPIP
ncbi:MAG: hypothetical protein ACD_19C00191G0003 [uncultured bacterium]|nr:MAG: hypothetical protein ACD_19C00191G0003 [uncultured bacterium]